jgi:hypothetical protein
LGRYKIPTISSTPSDNNVAPFILVKSYCASSRFWRLKQLKNIHVVGSLSLTVSSFSAVSYLKWHHASRPISFSPPFVCYNMKFQNSLIFVLSRPTSLFITVKDTKAAFTEESLSSSRHCLIHTPNRSIFIRSCVTSLCLDINNIQ